MKNILKQAENAERLLKLTSDTMLLLNRDGICMDIAVYNVNLWFMKEEKLLGTAAFRQKIATAIANGVISYFNWFDNHKAHSKRG